MNFLRSFYFFSTICLAFLTTNVQAQTGQDEENPSNDESVVLYADSRLAILTTYNYKEPVRSGSGTAMINGKAVSGSIHSGRGYRVLIYSGTDRAKANKTKADFMRRHPGKRVYMTYSLPQYKIKVGDYTSRQEANEFYRELSGVYSPCMVVPDIVEINTFRKND